MFSSEFTWCDLSTFDLARACAFYRAVLDWTSHGINDNSRDDDYTIFYSASTSSAGVYTMPEFFQDIGMPSFWMSYVRVKSLNRSVDRAVKLGARCEIEPAAFDSNSRFALIRDPAGAGFTLYEGPELSGRDQQGRHGRMQWNELHVPSLGMVGSFYQNLFGWDIAPDRSLSNRHIIHAPSGDAIASILELDEKTKGPKNYWTVIFATRDLNATLKTVTRCGGQVLMTATAGIDFAMATDDQGATFCVSATGAE